MSSEALVCVSQAQRALHLLQGRPSLQVEALATNPRVSNNDVCLAFMLQACQTYFDASTTVIKGLESPEYSHTIDQLSGEALYTAQEVEFMFCQLLSGFSKNLTEFFQEKEIVKSSLRDIGDDTLDYVLSFLWSSDLSVVRQTCKSLQSKCEALLAHQVTFRTGNPDTVVMSLGGWKPFMEVKEMDVFPQVNYSKTKKVSLQLCCPNHSGVIMSEVEKIPNFVELEITIHECLSSNPRACLEWLEFVLNKNRSNIETLSIGLSGACLVNFNSFANCLCQLYVLKSLSVVLRRFNEDVLESVFDLSSLGRISSSVQSFRLQWINRHVLTGLESLPWEQMKSISFGNVVLRLNDWKIIMDRMEQCEDLILDNFELHNTRMTLMQFLNHKVCQQLKKLEILYPQEWINVSERLWSGANRLPSLKRLSLLCGYSSKTILSLCEEASGLTHLTVSLLMDRHHWTTDRYVVERDVIKQAHKYLKVLPDMIDFRFGFSDSDSAVDFEKNNYTVSSFKSRKQIAQKLKKLNPQLQSFRYTPPGANQEDELFDLNAFIALNQSINILDSQTECFQRDLEDKIPNGPRISGLKRRRME
jgi:hypothetical protein